MPDQATWTEDDSAPYRELAPVAVPDRAEQIAVIATLAPFSGHESFRMMELAAGEGLFAAVLLAAFPNASYVGLDGSATRWEAAGLRLCGTHQQAKNTREIPIHSRLSGIGQLARGVRPEPGPIDEPGLVD